MDEQNNKSSDLSDNLSSKKKKIAIIGGISAIVLIAAIISVC